MTIASGNQQFEVGRSVKLDAVGIPAPLTSAEFLSAALIQASVGTWQVDMLTGLSTWDAVTSEILGLSAVPMAAGGLLPVHPDDRAYVWERLERRAAEGGTDDIECRILRPNGEIRWLRATGRQLADGSEKTRYVAGIITDITEQKAAAENLRQAEERYRLVSQVTADLIFDWDVTNDRLTWNEFRGLFFGYTSEELCSMSALRFKIHPDDQERVVEEFRAVFEGEHARYMSEHRFLDSNGNFSDVHSCGYIVRDPSGSPIRMIGSIQDVTERRYADAALRESEAINRGIVEASSDSVVLLDLEGKLLFLNKSGGLTTTAQDLAAHYGKHWTAAWPQHAWAQLNKAIATAADGHTAQVTESFMLNGQARWWDITLSPIRDDSGVPIKLVAIARDITQRRESEEKLRRAASYDSLTLLPNRACFQDRLNAAVSQARQSGGVLGLLLLDVDDFKQVNDSLGHDAGDALLKSIASRLESPSVPHSALARLGGDEFAVLLEDVSNETELTKHAQTILDRMREPLVYASRVLDCSVTIGAAIFPDHGGTPDELLKNADIALYVAKDGFRGSVAVFESRHREGLQTRAAMVSLARTALREKRIEPYYQPKVVLGDHFIAGFEALLRWQHPTKGTQLPASIAAAFEDLEVATAISRNMIDQVIGDIGSWLEHGLLFEHVAVNAAAAEFRNDNFAESILDRLYAAGIPNHYFQLEVTETVFLGKGSEYVDRALKLLDREGVRIALDDFGTGYASLRHLKQFPVHVMKIDQGFVRGMCSNPGDAAIISAVVNLGKSLNIDVVAEGIESTEQEARLQALGCKYGQGFLYSPAVPAAEVMGLLKNFPQRIRS